MDDEPDIREILKENLLERDESIRFIEASHSKEAISIFENESPKVTHIICDYNMPGGHGDELFQYWRENLFHLPFILLSSEVKRAEKSFAKQCDLDFSRLLFIEKSGDMGEFLKGFNDIKENGFLEVPFEDVKPELPLELPLYVSVNNKKIIRLYHEGSSIPLEKYEDFATKGVKKFFIPFGEARRKCLRWPLHTLNRREPQSITFERAFQSFIESHEAALLSLSSHPQALRLSFDRLGHEVEMLQNDSIYKKILEGDLTSKDYVINHSFLICSLSYMAVQELDLNFAQVKKTILRGILFHDLFKTNEQAYKDDLLKRNLKGEELKKQRLQLSQMISTANEMGLNSDSIAIIEALNIGLHDPDFHPRGNHKLAKIALSFHRFSNELYLSSFRPEVKAKEISGGDKQIENFLTSNFDLV